jgi:hypothetical protein
MTDLGKGFPHIQLHDPVHFSSEMPKAGSPLTEPIEDPELAGRRVVRFVRKFFNDTLHFPANPDGRQNGVPKGQGPVDVEVWSFEDDTSGRRLPAPLIRAREGDIVRVVIEPSKRVHTIHLHGIEPDPRNDGVGHTSFEVTGSYEYLFSPQLGRNGDPDVGTAGSYFYHCHVNTVLHVQMGMFGPLVIDPPSGPGRAFVDGPDYNVGTETFWATFAVDPRWHTLGHAAGLAGEDVGLNRFDPSHFLLGAQIGAASTSTASPGSYGTFHDSGDSGSSGSSAGGPLLAPKVTAFVSGKPTLIRIVNGTYIPAKFTFPFPIDVIASDGRPFRDTSVVPAPSATPYSRPVACPVKAGESLIIGAAERYDLLLRPTQAGTVRGRVEFLDWITGMPSAGSLVEPEIEVKA